MEIESGNFIQIQTLLRKKFDSFFLILRLVSPDGFEMERKKLTKKSSSFKFNLETLVFRLSTFPGSMKLQKSLVKIPFLHTFKIAKSFNYR